ncbi:hypothetical protein ACFWPK_14745 [Nocardia sp. NPDC058519]|uniref:hypothetical protein n=1 Tax=Nocardia sp. NPDC058519 TaxID=3346535 RepID=UPI0036660068
MINTTKDFDVCQTNEYAVDSQSVRMRLRTPSRYCAQRNIGSKGLYSCCPDDPGAECPVSGSRSQAVAPGVSGGPRGEFHVIARLDAGDSVADVFSSDIFDVASGIRQTADWPRSLPVRQGTTVGLDELDQTLSAAGYQRSSSWRKRVTTSGVVRYFADATTQSCARGQTR